MKKGINNELRTQRLTNIILQKIRRKIQILNMITLIHDSNSVKIIDTSDKKCIYYKLRSR